MKIFITGCAGSGTTLLRKLFYAFQDVEIIDGQTSLQNFIVTPSKKRFVIAKRTGKTIFSGIGHDLARKQLTQIRKNKIKILNIIRDGRDVLINRPFELKPQRWVISINQRLLFPQGIDLEVKYEDLCLKPDEIQKLIIEKFGLIKKHNFSEYPMFLPGITSKDIKPNASLHMPRPIDIKSIQKGDSWKKLCTKKEILLVTKVLKDLGYVA
jgi:hypothetical protein